MLQPPLVLTRPQVRPFHRPVSPFVPRDSVPIRVSAFENIFIDGTRTEFYTTPQQYVDAVNSLLQTLRGSQTGRAVLDEVHANWPRTVTIIPYELAADLNAYSHPLDWAGSQPKGASVIVDGKRIYGNGKGSDTQIWFTPGRFAQNFTVTMRANPNPDPSRISAFPSFSISYSPGSTPEDLLLHEMTHTTRQLEGLMDQTALPDDYDDEEEFIAILVANIYASEKGRPGDLRQNHHVYSLLSQDTDEKFLPKRDETDYHYRTVGKFIRTQPRLTSRLEKIPSAFNPIRRYRDLQYSRVLATGGGWTRP